MLANVRDQYAFKILDPAVEPDQDKFVRPKKPVIVVVGFLFGLSLGLFLAFFHRFVVYARQGASGQATS